MSEIKLDTKSMSDLAESVSMILYRAKVMTQSAMIIVESKDYIFEQGSFKQDNIFYQLENIFEYLNTCEKLFDDTALNFIKNRNDSVA